MMYYIPGYDCLCDSYYGGYRTRTFADIFPSLADFSSRMRETPIDFSGLSDKVEMLYYLLYARYGNSHIAFTDENQFRYNVFTLMWQYGPTWSKRLDIQKSLRELSEDQLKAGGKAIYNTSYNPSTEPSTGTTIELTTINQQNTTNKLKSPMEAYATVSAMLEDDVTESFISKFKKLFIKVAEEDYPLVYITEV